ncbi:TnsD family Tn7-like transposition protein [Niveibacterium sp.]|uniref:TnsD family Tn7-like transposition protein n=1 Tax=Niveibacterium sp. TaxID=2017444 RepID=UPI0035ADD6F4
MDTNKISHLGSNPLPSWLPDESLFSLVSRTHRLWGYPLASTTASILFGHAHGGTHHDLPTRLDEFARRTAGLLGDAVSIGASRTMFRYYRTFLPADERGHVLDALRGPTVAHLKLRLGLLTSRFRAHHPLKACESCMREDADRHGSAYWHLAHQFPGVWTCTRHGDLLRESMFKATGVGRFQWHLPELSALQAWDTKQRAALEPRSERIVALSRLITTLVDASREVPIAPGRLTELYRMVLAERGWTTPSGSLRIARIAESFADYAGALRLIPELRALPESAAEAVRQLPRLLRPMRSGTHPIRHFVIIGWLFDGPQPFLDAYQATAKDVLRHAVVADGVQPMSLPASQLDVLRALVANEGLSVTGAAHRLGVDVATAAAWAARCGITPSRRPKRLQAFALRDLITDLRGGLDKALAADRYAVSVSTVTRILRTEPGLQDTWHQVRFQQAQERARAAWRVLLLEHGSLGMKFLRGLDPGSHAWLYRNDRSWLQSQTPARTSNRASKTAQRVQWDQRDEALCHQVETVAEALLAERANRTLKLWELYQRIPELKAKLAALERLPLTRRAIERALRPSKPASEQPLL